MGEHRTSDPPYGSAKQARCYFERGHNFGREWRIPVRLPLKFCAPVADVAPRAPAYWSERMCDSCGYLEYVAHGFTPGEEKTT